jgi:hypothetical protein
MLALIPKWAWALLAVFLAFGAAFFMGRADGARRASEELGRYKEAQRVFARDLRACRDSEEATRNALDRCNQDKIDAEIIAKIKQQTAEQTAEAERRKVVAELTRLMATNAATPLPAACEDAVREWARREAEIGVR